MRFRMNASPQIFIFPRHLLLKRYPPRRAVSMEQLEPAYQVVAMLPVRSTTHARLDRRGK